MGQRKQKASKAWSKTLSLSETEVTKSLVAENYAFWFGNINFGPTATDFVNIFILFEKCTVGFNN